MSLTVGVVGAVMLLLALLARDRYALEITSGPAVVVALRIDRLTGRVWILDLGQGPGEWIQTQH